MIWALMGTAMHTILERGGVNHGGMIEQRLYTEIDGWRVSGQFDYMDSDGIIWDWKLASVWEVMNGVKESREQQLNAYSLLASRNGHQPTGLRVGFILRDWSPSEMAKAGNGYPPHQVFTHAVNLLPIEQTELNLVERVKLHKQARLSLPECTKEERWAQDDKYAVIKQGAKRASRLFAGHDAATEYADSRDGTYRVELRPGNSVRCASYCAVSQYCDQWKGLQR